MLDLMEMVIFDCRKEDRRTNKSGGRGAQVDTVFPDIVTPERLVMAKS